jgi:hypothetical protein
MARKYAAAVPEAAMQNFGSLAQRLGNVGPQDMRTMTSLLQPTRIKAMAEEFANRLKKKPEKPRSGAKLTLSPHY